MFKYALKLVLNRKLRTFLTSLGIMIAVMLMTFILFGMSDLKTAVVGEFSNRFKPEDLYVSGKNVMMFAGMNTAPSKEDSEKEEKILDSDMLNSITNINGVISADPIFSLSSIEIYLEGDSTPYPNGFIGGADFPGSHHIYNGFYGEDDVLGDGEVFVSDFVTSFFELENDEIIGKKLIFKSKGSSNFLSLASKSMIDKGYEFTITGVTNSGNDPFFINTNEALKILVDLGGFQNKEEYLEKVGYSQILIVTETEKTAEIESTLKDDMGLYVISTETLLGFLDTLTSGLTIALILFGSISALVASIGIINTMIMSIYEQTKEIGIIKAMGASNSQVLFIFLIQSAVIGLIGGLMGLGITFLIMQISDPFVVKILNEQGFSSIEKFFNFQPINALYITLGSILIGVLAGLYPARKASTIDPIQALRYD